MTLSRWRRVVTGVAAGVIVLCAALVGASFRDDGAGVSVASDLRPANIIPIEEDPIDDDVESAEAGDSVTTADDTGDADDAGQVQVDASDTDDATTDEANDDQDALTEPVQVIETDASDTDGAEPAETTGSDTDGAESDGAGETDGAASTDDLAAGDDTETAEQAPATADDTPSEQAPQAPLTATDDALGTGGGVDDAECALDRLVIYAGARRGGVAGSIRAALAQAGFGAGCPTPVTVLASNCPLQFSGVLGSGSGYDPNKSFVASSASVDRETMTAVMSAVGYAGNQIDILDFGFVNADQPGEQWMAIFVPPSFEGWQDLAARAGLSPTTSSLCAASGQLAG